MFFGGGNISGRLAELLLGVPAVIWAISFHEFCHGYAALKLGDPTASVHGRLSLNPLNHFDLVGTLMLLIFGIGWAKPVPINPYNFKHPRRDTVIVSLAGCAGNILTAFVCVRLMKFFPYLFRSYGMQLFINGMLSYNIGLAAFNLLPIPPLDGSHILYVMLPPRFMSAWYFVERYGIFVIILLVLTGTMSIFMMPIILFIYMIIGGL